MVQIFSKLFTGEYNRGIVDFTSFAADVFTVALGSIGLFSLLWYRRTISHYLAVLNIAHATESSRRIRETLTNLERLSYDNKDERPEIRALLGQLSGQLSILRETSDVVKQAHDELEKSIANGRTLTEAIKRRVVHSVHGAIDHSFQVGLRQIQEGKT